MKRRHVLCSLFLPLLLLAQETVAPPKPPKPQFFAGVVIEIDPEHIKVTKSSVGHPPETHIFALDAKTKTPKGGVKVKSRVTVRFEHSEERDMALEIQVRSQPHTQKTT